MFTKSYNKLILNVPFYLTSILLYALIKIGRNKFLIIWLSVTYLKQINSFSSFSCKQRNPALLLSNYIYFFTGAPKVTVQPWPKNPWASSVCVCKEYFSHVYQELHVTTESGLPVCHEFYGSLITTTLISTALVKVGP